jgi:hypothetical protein
MERQKRMEAGEVMEREKSGNKQENRGFSE